MATARSAADPVVRPARVDELGRLREIEIAAGQAFTTVGMDWVAADDPPSIGELRRYVEEGLAWVIGPGDGGAADAPVVGYVIVDVLPDALVGPAPAALHIEQVSVDPAAARRRLGARLIDRVADEARARSIPAVTLTTFQAVPWNAPYYERCGFRVVADDEMGPGLRRLRADEAARGLDVEPRVAMRRTI